MSLLLITVGAIFSMSTKATNLSNANNEVMNSLRAFEQQIRRDFEGLRKECFVGFCYNYLPARQVDANRPPTEMAVTRADTIVFFANGDFQTIRQRWDANTKTFTGPAAVPIRSNLARVEYGILGTHDSMTGAVNAKPLSQLELGRFAKLMIPNLYPGTTAAQLVDDPPAYYLAPSYGFRGFSDGPTGAANAPWPWDKATDVYENWEYEYETPASWHNPFEWPAWAAAPTQQSYLYHLIGRHPLLAAHRNNLWLGLPYIDVAAASADHLRMIPGCVEFKIQRWAETDPVNPANANWFPRWWPENNDNNDNDGNFGTPPLFPLWTSAFVPGRQIWESFNGPQDSTLPASANPVRDWPQDTNAAVTADMMTRWLWITRGFTDENRRAVRADFPKAIKITVSLVDANRRQLGAAPPVPGVWATVPGAQTYTMVIPLE